jgi:TonB family protein
MSETDEHVGVVERTGNFIAGHRTPVIVTAIALALASALFYALLNTAAQPPEKQAPVITVVKIIPPKPPPPPPKPIVQQKTILPQKVVMPTPKPITPNQPPKLAPPKAPGPPPLGTSIHNNTAPDSFDLSGDTSGNGLVGGTGGGGGGSYDGVIAAEIESALTNDPKTRYASAGMRVDAYLNPAGTATRVVIVKSSGDPAVDNAVESDILHNQFPPPPPDKPMPIHINVNGQQPL